MKTVYIYGICSPFGELVYIGKTINPTKRFLQHLKRAAKEQNPKAAWIRSLQAKNLKPDIFIIDEVPGENWEFWEDWYMQYYKFLGCKLLNWFYKDPRKDTARRRGGINRAANLTPEQQTEFARIRLEKLDEAGERSKLGEWGRKGLTQVRKTYPKEVQSEWARKAALARWGKSD